MSSTTQSQHHSRSVEPTHSPLAVMQTQGQDVYVPNGLPCGPPPTSSKDEPETSFPSTMAVPESYENKDLSEYPGGSLKD